MKLEQCLAALRALPKNETHFVMPFRLLSGFDQTQEVLAATEKRFWELLATKKIKSIDVMIAGKIVIFETDIYEFRLKLDKTSIRQVKFIVDGQYSESNIKSIRAATTKIVAEPGQEKVWQLIIKNLFRASPEFVFKQLNAIAPIESVNVMFRPTFRSEPGAVKKEEYENRLVTELARAKPTYIALSLNDITQELKAEEIHHIFDLFAKAGCYQIDLSFKGLPRQAEKLVTAIVHEKMIAEGSPWKICAIKRDHVAKFQTRVQENYRNKKATTPERKEYRTHVKSGFFRPSKLKQVEVAAAEPDLAHFFTAYFN